MTPKQKRFFEEYNKCNDKIKAYQSVYKCNESIARLRANELLSRDDKKEEITLIEENSSNVDAKFIISNLKDIALNSAKESDRIRALEILAKLTGAFNSVENELVIKIDY